MEVDPYYAYAALTLAVLQGPLDDADNTHLAAAADAAMLAHRLQPDIATLEAVVTVLLTQGKVKLALDMVTEVRKRGDRAPRTLALLAQVYTHSEKLESKVRGVVLGAEASLGRQVALTRVAAWSVTGCRPL